LIIILYPILSAFPQEIVYRSFFFKRYGNLFKNKKVLIFVNAFLFSFAHIIYLNPIVIFFTFIGGLIMAESYSKHNSLIKVSIEHGLYGDIVFTSGLGAYFYHAQGFTIS
jgi:membrane protease YdiL (CAAX protease family)